MYLIQGGSRGTGDAAPPASDDGHPAGGPSAGLLLTEPIRGLADLAALLLASPGLAAAPRGDGHGVLVFPGLLAGDSSTVPLRAFLRWLGYDVRGWDLGRNHGPTEAVLAGMPGSSSIMPNEPAGPYPWSAGAWAACTPGRWRACIPGKSARSLPWAALTPWLTRGRATPTVPIGASVSCTPPPSGCPAASSGPGRSTCRRRRSTPGWTVL